MKQADPTVHTISTGSGTRLVAQVVRRESQLEVLLGATAGTRCLLHWGLRRKGAQGWVMPQCSAWPAGTVAAGQSAVQTPLPQSAGAGNLAIRFDDGEEILALEFVLFYPDQGRWDNNHGRNYRIPLQTMPGRPGGQGNLQLTDIADEIVRAETTHNSWTLMHRFNLCYDLLDRVGGSLDGQALLYVYLRFSAIRQLTWQRNYNTKPRELAHAQERFTYKLAEVYRSEVPSRPLVRLTLATVGRGGEGQRIRDEILNIMHRHHVKEVSGHFLEEWHQKLHNNTTPDDLVICEAYLAFLRQHGNRDVFYQTLEGGGVTRQRLESFERPIRSHPDFAPHLRDGLIHDFENFLRILKASHSGTDLETAIHAVRGHIDSGLQGQVNYLWERRNDGPDRLLDLVRQITEARHRLSALFSHSGGLRELLYLDLALEQLLRAVVERNIHLKLSGDQLVDLVASVLENVTLSCDESELAVCWRHWDRLRALPRFEAEWSLHAKSVADRIGRTLSGWIDRMYHLLQPKAEYLGHGFQAEEWSVRLFSEEVVRGGSLGFVLSMLLRHLDPVLRKAAHLGNWQIISRGRGAGMVEVVEALRSIQGRRFDGPAVVVADKVAGDEEIPENVTAVIAPDVVDIVSHVAVRARNANVLFASCHDCASLQRLKSFRGRHLQLEINPAGDVISTEAAPATGTTAVKGDEKKLAGAVRSFTRYAVPEAEFDQGLVGGKSWNQARLRGRLPGWIHLPASAALPYGVFEKVLGLEQNREVYQGYAELSRQVADGNADVLSKLRQTITALAAPEELKAALRSAMDKAGLTWPGDWESAWKCIKQVWASKWNDRAFLSRQRVGLPHELLFMAVLIQEVVPADYAFVLHTVNPSNGNSDELFGEVVPGLGETLVGNYPGRALSFVCPKAGGDPKVLTYPSKSTGLYGGGLIFRSDSSGEDLAGYAGAGLYDSVLLTPPRTTDLDYSNEPLVWDGAFRRDLLGRIAQVGLAVENLSGSPQDVEGAVSAGNYFVVQARPQAGV